MEGVWFGNLHSYDDLDLLLVSKEIGSPPVKQKKTDIDGADSAIDWTDFFGEPKYEDVTHKLGFVTIVPQTDFLTQYSKVKNALHGKKERVIFEGDPLYYYNARLFVSKFTNEKGVGNISVECDCEPYKYKVEKTAVTQAVTGTQTITLTNGRKRAVPEVTIATDATMRIEYQGVNIWDLGSGSFTLPELELVQGDNAVTVTGTGTITFTWQEGDL